MNKKTQSATQGIIEFNRAKLEKLRAILREAEQRGDECVTFERYEIFVEYGNLLVQHVEETLHEKALMFGF